jgi:hypothetical protein
MALPVFAMDIAKDPAVYIEGIVLNQEDVNNRGTAAVAVLNDGTFADLSGYYATGLTNSGFGADIYYDPAGGVDYSGYDIVVATAADNWWASVNYPMEITAWAAYADGGGKVLLVGQDFLWGSQDYSFPVNYCGMASATEDVASADASELTWVGTAGGPLEGMTDSFLDCFEANDWYTDDITAASQQIAEWSTVNAGGPYGSGSAAASGIFSATEFGCGNVDVIFGTLTYFGLLDPTSTGDATFSSVKALY